MHVFAIVVSVSSAPGSLKTAFLRAESIDSFDARKGPSSAFACVTLSASLMSVRQCWNARLYVEKSLFRHAFVSFRLSSTTRTSRTRSSWTSSPSHGIADGSAFFFASTRTTSCRFEHHFETTSSRKYISCFTRSMYGCITSYDAAYIAFLCASSPVTGGSARASERYVYSIETRSAPRFSIASSSDIPLHSSANCSA